MNPEGRPSEFEKPPDSDSADRELVAERERQLWNQTTVYINAGGRGTRLRSVLPSDAARGVTKALMEFPDEPIIQYQTDRALERGAREVLVGAGDHKNIEEYFSAPARQDKRLSVAMTEHQEGTGGDLIKALREHSESGPYVLVTNTDTLLDVDEGAVLRQHADSGAAATIVLTRRTGVPNEGAFTVSADGRVLASQESITEHEASSEPEGSYTASSTGMVVMNAETLRDYPWQPGERSISLYGEILGKLIERGQLRVFDNGKNFFVDIGTPEAYNKVMRHPVLKKILTNRSAHPKEE